MASIFQRCGGFAAVSKVVLAFYDKVLDSDVSGPYFENVNMKSMIDHQTKFIAQVMGGPVAYSNEQLRRVHAHHNIQREAFEDVARLMKESLEDFDFAASDIDLIMNEMDSRSHCIVSS